MIQLAKSQASIRESLLSQKSTQPSTQRRSSFSEKVASGSSPSEYLFFSWVMPMLKLGSRSKIQIQDLPKLPSRYTTQEEFNSFSNFWNQTSRSKKQGFTLIKVLAKTFKRQCILLFFLVAIMQLLVVARPLLTAYSINYISTNREDKGQGIILFFATLICLGFSRTCYAHFYYRLAILGVSMSNIVTMMIFKKSLKYSELANKEFTQAQIINYSQVDAERLTNIGFHLAAFFYGPFEFIIGLSLLYWVLGITFLVGIGLIIMIMIISYFLTKKIASINKKILQAKDERMKITKQMLDIIRFVKISAIEKYFYNKLSSKRAKEVALYMKSGMFFIGSICVYWITSPLIQSLSFLVYVLLGNQISAEVAFTTMSITTLFDMPLVALPQALTEVAQILVSLKRIEKFLFAQEIKNEHIVYKKKDNGVAIQIQNGNFYWKKQKKDKKSKQNDQDSQQQNNLQNEQDDKEASQNSSNSISINNQKEADKLDNKFKTLDQQGKPIFTHTLKDINLKIKKAKFTMIVGDIGCGKSSLLMAILNQMMSADNSKITICGEIAYSAQKSWIMSKTLQENIIFLSQFDGQKLKQILHYASLENDIKILPKGLETEIGEKGINISGGQKARVSLARSLYSEKDILLLDDILSAVDVHVADFIVRQTFLNYLSGKTIVLPTHAIKFASFADEIVIMKKGRIVKVGTYEDICNSEEFQELSIKQHQRQQKQNKKEDDEQAQIEVEMAMIKEVIQKKKLQDQAKVSANELSNNKLIEELILPEDHDEGDFNTQMLKDYVKANKGLTTSIVICCFLFFGWIASRTASSIVLAQWCDEPTAGRTPLYIFIGLIMMAVVFIFIRATIFLIAGNNQSKLVHNSMIKSLLYADLNNFYNRVPIGRIINRLTKDLRDLDQVIMEYFVFVFISSFDLMGSLFICIYAGTPYSIIPMFVVGVLANIVRIYYLRTQRQVARYEKITNSPAVSGFMSTISGLSTIRAFKKEDNFNKAQIQYFDVNKKVRISKSGIQNWFALMVSYLSFMINMPCIAFCLFNHSTDPAIMGLLMVYALKVSDSVVWLVRSQADFESKLISIERIYKFMNIQPEQRYIQYCKDWDSQEESQSLIIEKGSIEFINMNVKYRKDLPDVLKDVNCTIVAGEKIGIVGRTGAGKTTIINTLLGTTQISSGNILIDKVPINSIPIKALRQSVTMIDQEPTLIKSTFRQNLDITNRYSDQEFQKILEECNLWEAIQEKGGLQGQVSNTSLSAGQKQLLCICRAFLKHSKIILIDEATANIDVKNDALIQKVIAQKFKESTVLTIAHRLSTLKNSNKIMVMEEGKLVEFGTPDELQEKKGGIYSEMMQKNAEEMLK